MAWKLQEFFNQDLAIMLVIATGAFSVWRNIVFTKTDLRVFNVFLFKITLPASVILGLGIKTDLYDEDIWRFVSAFLMMRAIMLVGCALVFGLLLRRSLGEVTANWLSTTWISTVILGTPLLKVLLGPQYASLGVVAGISSFIFQLPLMLILFEVHAWREENLRASLPQVQPVPPGSAEGQAPLLDGSEEETAPSPKRQSGQEDEPASSGQQQQQHVHAEKAEQAEGRQERAAGRPAVRVALVPTSMSAADATTLPAGWQVAGSSAARLRQRLLGCLHFRMTRKQGQRLGLRLIMNHVLWGVGIGIVLSLSTVGPTWLDPGVVGICANCDAAIGAGFIYIFVEYFARCTEPVAFFGTGMWMVRRNPIACGWIPAFAYMVVKLILVPLLMVGCCFAVGLEGAMARAAVLVATLPVSAAAFALSKTYNVGEDVAAANVFLGNLLILPTTIAWLESMDSIGLFPATFNAAGSCPNPGGAKCP